MKPLSDLLDAKIERDSYKYSLHEKPQYDFITGANSLKPLIMELAEALECAEAALAVSTCVVHGKYNPEAFGLKETKKALQKLRKELGG